MADTTNKLQHSVEKSDTTLFILIFIFLLAVVCVVDEMLRAIRYMAEVLPLT